MSDHSPDPLPASEGTPRRWDAVWMTLATQLAEIKTLLGTVVIDIREIKTTLQDHAVRLSELEKDHAARRARESREQQGRTGMRDRVQTFALALAALASVGSLAALLMRHG